MFVSHPYVFFGEILYWYSEIVCINDVSDYVFLDDDIVNKFAETQESLNNILPRKNANRVLTSSVSHLKD